MSFVREIRALDKSFGICASTKFLQTNNLDIHKITQKMEPLSSSLNNIEPLLSSKELPPSGSVHDKFQSRSSECKVVYVELNDYITIKCNNYDKKINMEDVIGVERKDSSSLIIHAYPINQCCCGGERQHEATILEASNIDQANRWYLRLKQKLLKVPFETKENELPFRRFLILVNPASGSGQALVRKNIVSLNIIYISTYM